MTDWLDTSRDHRQIFEIHTGDYERHDTPVEVDLTDDIQQPRLFEIDSEGNVIDAAITLQLDGKKLIFIIKGTTPPHTVRRYQLYFEQGAGGDYLPASPPLIALTDGVMHEGQESYRIATQAATYYYHERGAGFASMLDIDGNDWLSFHPWGGSDGKYRGIPNLVHPEGHFHPGGTDCSSEIVSAGSIKATIRSWSNDDKWASAWEIYPTYARLTILKVDHPYWFLYEGTPGGVLDEAGDYMVRSDGERIAASQRWDAPLPEPEWIYFGASNTERVLFLIHHEADAEIDSYWPMEHNMTVFGFGRSGLEKYMTRIPAHFTIGFAECSDFESVSKVINAVYHPPVVHPGAVETRE